MQLAQGEFISFLNHDDLFLRDHLDYSIEQITAQNSDFHIGLSANATELNYKDDETVIPVFTSLLPKSKDLSSLILSNPWLFEPSSFWLIRTSYAKAVGFWNPSTSLWRTPLRDWLMRAWRQGGKFSFGDKITGVKFYTLNLRQGAPLYTNITQEHDYMVQSFENESPEEIRQWIRQQIEAAQKTDLSTKSSKWRDDSRFLNIDWGYWENETMKYFHLRQILADLYLKRGIDPLNIRSRLLFRSKGSLHKKLIQKRTGEKLVNLPSIAHLLQNPEAYRVV